MLLERLPGPPPDRVKPSLLPDRSPRRSSANAAPGGLTPTPAGPTPEGQQASISRTTPPLKNRLQHQSSLGVRDAPLHSRWRGYAGVVRCDRLVRIAPVDAKDVRTPHMRRWLRVGAEDWLRLAVADCVRWWIGTGARAVGVTQIWGCVRTRWEMPCIPDLVCLGLADWDARCRGDMGVRAGVAEREFRLSCFAPGWSDCLVLWSVITLADFANGTALVISMYVRYCGWLPSC